jgi:sugar phosphate isomerase/epimerase
LKRKLAATESAIRIAKAVIQTGGAEGAGKEARDDAKRATRELDALLKKEKALRLALGEITPPTS